MQSLMAKVAGNGSLRLLSLARSTGVRMRAPWPDPGFGGATLPLERSVTVQGFTAHWHMLDSSRSYGQHRDAGSDRIDDALRASASGVEPYRPAGLCQRNERAGKYGLLFIAMTFVAFFLFEMLRRLRVHPVQYLLIGAALATFYVLLLALSEQIGFGPAYAVAEAALVPIVAGCATAVLPARRAGSLLGGVPGMAYAMLYGQYVLPIGSMALPATVALMMYLTRRIDWYGCAPAAAAPAAAIMERP
ncbi:hypothetical protein ASG87_08620 [Frateuria sp. Soil773]|uniref:inner membrane CreD family protein n=1 Tax=Frateuria sp. Soil773 TaxID=1736407 RepID=UPI0006FD995B|nr:inner membrane CreD family protein [Frateuria sp. Soil773]KRE88634.1 hypothetical protein ASG87_08620 [Frateuria sp. Soil773]